MFESNDGFTSTFNRVRGPWEPEDYYGERFSTAFTQSFKDTLSQGPKKYYLVTEDEFIAKAMSVHFTALQAKPKVQAEAGANSGNDWYG
ncbi:uncharacterized protein BCR38DRAFT_485400 [Pseudomassariella vexata]|uniref:Uncharacterized protein n=1 Tax=Pseudomassariella vexata TaxID=1141098 RepID=A0A1Y2DY84_9PEZI|nr:uncharacterized protein BCR38DRAFT_485400 [Pseudomassariella vexata]ORY64262.1 hypothetical protein BCR38DRAFT_485400 [Pseudomassariella vexata]